MARKYERDPVREICNLRGERSIEAIIEDIQDTNFALDYLTTGQMVSLGAAYEKIGQMLIEKAQEAALRRGREKGSFEEDHVRFEYRKESEFQVVDSAAVQERYPPEGNEALYKTQSRKEHIQIHVLKR